jgi:hypothetical protein
MSKTFNAMVAVPQGAWCGWLKVPLEKSSNAPLHPSQMYLIYFNINPSIWVKTM